MFETEAAREPYSGEFTTKTPLIGFFLFVLFSLKKPLTGCLQENITPKFLLLENKVTS